MTEQVIDNILQYLKSTGAPVKSLKPSDMLFETGVLDSFTMVELIGFVEQKYGIQLDAEDLVKENLETLEKLAALIVRKQKR